MASLIKYEAACRALAECKSVDEVKTWVDKAAAMQAYGRMAKDKTLEVDAAEIRIRSERRLGEMLTATKAEGGLNQAATLKRGPVVVSNDHGKSPKLADAGISKDLSSRAQKLAAVPEADFEAELAAKRERDRKDGARVSARLEKKGAKALQQREQPQDDGPDADEIAAGMAAERADTEALQKLLHADDKLATAYAEIKRLNAELSVVKQARDGFMNKANELIKTVKRLQAKLDKVGA